MSCLNCEKGLAKTIYPNGKVENEARFRKRKFCSVECSINYNKKNKKGYWKSGWKK
jgi:hypothetical protein